MAIGEESAFASVGFAPPEGSKSVGYLARVFLIALAIAVEVEDDDGHGCGCDGRVVIHPCFDLIA